MNKRWTRALLIFAALWLLAVTISIQTLGVEGMKDVWQRKRAVIERVQPSSKETLDRVEDELRIPK
jgi:hypothetical protein